MKQKRTRFCAALLLCGLLWGILPVRAAAADFRDVPDGHWAEDSISRCAELGFFQGTSAGVFGLGQSMTRCAAAVVLDRFFGWEDAEFVLPYEDVPADAWYAPALRAAYANGAVTAQSLQFRPADPITREELAVMLIRALGYGEIAGVAQDLLETFTDLKSNPGYIAMARDLGLVSGIREDTFAPDRYATREQVAVILMRLYDKLQAETPAGLEIVSGAEEMAGLDTVVLDGAMILSSGLVRERVGTAAADSVRAAAGEGELLLYASGTDGFLSGQADTVTEKLVAMMEEQACGGLLVEIDPVSPKNRTRLTAFAEKLKAAMGEAQLLLVLPAPTKASEIDPAAGAYDYAALSRAADGLVLRTEPTVKLADGFPVCPAEPLEELFWSASQLKMQGVDPAETVWILTAEGRHYSGERLRDTPDAEEIREKLESGWEYGYSDRYGCAYLEKPEANEAVWYLDGAAAEAHLQLLKLLGVKGICLEKPAAAHPDLLEALQ